MVKKINVSEIEARTDTKWPNGTLILDNDNKLKVFDGVSDTGTWPIDMYNNQNVADFLSNMGSNSISTTGSITVDGIYSNIVRRARNVGQLDTWTSLDNLAAMVGGAPAQLKVRSVNTNLTVTGSTVTYTNGNVAAATWDAVLVETNNYLSMSGGINNNGDTVVLTVTSLAGDEAYRVTAMRVSSVIYTTVIERIV